MNLSLSPHTDDADEFTSHAISLAISHAISLAISHAISLAI